MFLWVNSIIGAEKLVVISRNCPCKLLTVERHIKCGHSVFNTHSIKAVVNGVSLNVQHKQWVKIDYDFHLDSTLMAPKHCFQQRSSQLILVQQNK